MKCLLICDDTKPETVIDTCRQRGYGMEVQAFYHPKALSDRALLEGTADLAAGLPVISMHGPFGDLNPGSFCHRCLLRRAEQLKACSGNPTTPVTLCLKDDLRPSITVNTYGLRFPGRTYGTY